MKKNNLFFNCLNFSKRFLSILILLVFQQISFAQESPFPEGFEGNDFPPDGWETFIGTNALGDNLNWVLYDFTPYTANAQPYSNTGEHAAFVDRENLGGTDGSTEDWLVTPQFTPSNSELILTLMIQHLYHN